MRAITVVILLIFGSDSSVTAAPPVSVVVPPGTSVAGNLQGAWSVRWWQWASSFERADSPVADLTGEKCAAGQQGAVWFLAGVYGSAPVMRRCQVPAGKYLFFPIVNQVVFPRRPGAMTCDEATRAVQASTENPIDLTLIIDGVEIGGLEDFRQNSPECFNLGERAQRNISPAAASGYFIMLKPLAPGKHTIKWGGNLASITQAVVYELSVGDAEDST
jgi:hypothetical protein